MSMAKILLGLVYVYVSVCTINLMLWQLNNPGKKDHTEQSIVKHSTNYLPYRRQYYLSDHVNATGELNAQEQNKKH